MIMISYFCFYMYLSYIHIWKSKKVQRWKGTPVGIHTSYESLFFLFFWTCGTPCHLAFYILNRKNNQLDLPNQESEIKVRILGIHWEESLSFNYHEEWEYCFGVYNSILGMQTFACLYWLKSHLLMRWSEKRMWNINYYVVWSNM